VRTKIAKTAAFLALLIPVVLLEMYLCTAFLSARWQRAINDGLPVKVSLDQSQQPQLNPVSGKAVVYIAQDLPGL
jgi:hypothetical protein